MKKVNRKRPPISIQTQLRLWVAAAGRCEFLGCNEPLLRDSLTFSEGNYSNISHIVSWTPGGPRGDKRLSSRLAKDITNLMLTCQKHGKMIDIKKNIPFYNVDRLRNFKRLHEDRIRMQTDIKESHKTTVVRLMGNIRGRKVDVPQSDIYQSIIAEGRYPADEKGVLIDLTSISYSEDASFWDIAMRQIDRVLERATIVGNDETKHHHFSIFGIAPIPLLSYMGFKLGNAIPADIYIKTRSRNWLLQKQRKKYSPASFNLSCLRSANSATNVAVLVEVSGVITMHDVDKILDAAAPVLELRAAQPSVDVIQSVGDLEEFRKGYRSMIDEVRSRYGKETKIHLLGAMPSCAAIVCGREIIHGVDPPIIIYEHGDQSSGFFPAVSMN